MEKKFIDIEALFRDKNPKLLKFLPRFVLRYLKRIIHQDEVNDFMARNHDKMGVDFCREILKEFNISVNVIGAEHIPQTGGYIVAANHPLGGLDAIAAVTEIAKVRQDMVFIVNDLLLNLNNLRTLFTGVNKHGKNALESLQKVDELFASDKLVFVFPAGLVSRKRKGIISDLEWKKTFITRARKYHKSILPLYIEGRLSNFFYRLSNIRTALGIKANIEMLYLADEMYKQKNQTITLIFDPPVTADTFSRTKSDSEWAGWMKEKVYKLQTKTK